MMVRLFSRDAVAKSPCTCGSLPGIYKNAGIGRTTFWKAVRIYLQNGLDINSLHDGRQFRAKQGEIHYQKKTGRHAEYGSASEIIVTPEIRAQFDEAIKEYTSGRAQTLTKAYDFLCTAYYTETVCSADGKTLSLKPITERPSFRQFSYYASTVLTKEAKDIMKTSRQEQRNNQRLLLSDSLNGIFGPGDCVEIDETEADISLVSSIVPDVVVSRPIMHFMVDVYTRAIVAFSVSFENNSVLGLTNCLLNLSDDKVDLGRRYGIETSKDQWIPGFIPKRIRCDRGSEYRSNEAERIFNELGITRELVSPGAGSLKGVVEQMFRQFHLNVNPHTEHIGQTQKRHDSKHHQQATLNVEQFTAMVITFVITHNQSYMERYPRTADMYQQKIEPTPLDLWRYGVNQYGNPRPIVNREQFLYSLMKPVTVKISRSGLMWRGLNYLNLTDPYFRERMYSAGRKQEHFDARMDPRSVDALYYLHENRLMRAPLNDAKTGNTDFAGMTMKEYESFYREKKKQEKLGEEKNRQISVAAYETYRDITATAVEEKMDAPSIKNLIENRKEERFLTNYQNSIESRLTDTELEPVVIEPSVPKQATSLFDVESINPDSCDFWSKVDHASREENRKKQELLRNGGQS